MPEPPLSALYPILDAARLPRSALEDAVRGLARAGCRLVQLRAKELSVAELCEWADAAVAAARAAGIALVVNDRVDVALVTGATGVHVGQDDLSPGAARELLGPDAVLGLSTHSVEQARAAGAAPVDYVAIGPVFETRTKPAAERPVGLDGVRAARSVVTKPLVAIGGIELGRAKDVLDAGADALAVISALHRAVESGASWEEAARPWLSFMGEEEA